MAVPWPPMSATLPTSSPDQIHGQLITILKHGFQDMFRQEKLVGVCKGRRLGRLQDALGAFSVGIKIHVYPLSKADFSRHAVCTGP